MFLQLKVKNYQHLNYMVEQGGNPSSGVAVLANVSDSLDSLCFHLQENPILCNIHRTVLRWFNTLKFCWDFILSCYTSLPTEFRILQRIHLHYFSLSLAPTRGLLVYLHGRTQSVLNILSNLSNTNNVDHVPSR